MKCHSRLHELYQLINWDIVPLCPDWACSRYGKAGWHQYALVHKTRAVPPWCEFARSRESINKSQIVRKIERVRTKERRSIPECVNKECYNLYGTQTLTHDSPRKNHPVPEQDLGERQKHMHETCLVTPDEPSLTVTKGPILWWLLT